VLLLLFVERVFERGEMEPPMSLVLVVSGCFLDGGTTIGGGYDLALDNRVRMGVIINGPFDMEI
jgi:hypothetical protein